jgi:hypothetical protein
MEAKVSRVMLGTLSLALRAYEASANAVHRAASSLDIGEWLHMAAPSAAARQTA